MIDIFGPLGGAGLTSYELFCDEQSCDSVHPNDAGYAVIASKVYAALFGKPLPKDGEWVRPAFEPQVQVDTSDAKFYTLLSENEMIV